VKANAQESRDALAPALGAIVDVRQVALAREPAEKVASDRKRMMRYRHVGSGGKPVRHRRSGSEAPAKRHHSGRRHATVTVRG